MKDVQIWGNKTLTNLLEDIHDASLAKRKTLLDIITVMRGMLKDADSVVLIAPIIKEYIDVLVRSDEHLVKVATIVQRILSAEVLRGGGDESELLTEADREKLMGEVHMELSGALTEMEVILTSGSLVPAVILRP